MSKSKLHSILDLFLPDHFVENFKVEESYRARGFIGASLISITTSFVYILSAFIFNSPYVVKIAFFSNILFVSSLLFILRISPFGLGTKVRYLATLYIVFLHSIIFLAIYFDLGLGFFGAIWFFPLMITSSFLFTPKNYLKIFLLALVAIGFLSYMRLENFYDVIVKHSNFKVSYFFYYFASFISTFCYSFFKANLDENVFADYINKDNGQVRNVKYYALESMAAKVAHDVNNPLFVIQGKIHQLRALGNDQGADQSKMDTLVQEIETTIYDLSNRVKLISAFAKDGKNNQMVVVDVEKVVKDTLGSLAKKFSENEIIVEVYVDNKLSLICYPTYLREILVNLLNNAVEALAPLTLKNRIIQVKASMHNQWIHIEVKDNGREIKEDLVGKIFKAEFTTKDNSKNLGLGLTIVQGLSEMQDGKVSYLREEGMNVFRVELPSYEEDETEEDDDLDEDQEDES